MDNEFFEQILNSLQDGIYYLDRDRTITYWNRSAEQITGYPANEVVGRSCRNNLLNHVNEQGRVLCNDGCPMAATMQDGVPREEYVYLHHAEGHRVPVQIRSTPIRDEQGNIIGGTLVRESDTIESAIDRADRLMYQSKVNGRNRITIG